MDLVSHVMLIALLSMDTIFNSYGYVVIAFSFSGTSGIVGRFGRLFLGDSDSSPSADAGKLGLDELL